MGIYSDDIFEKNRKEVISREQDLFERVKAMSGSLCLNLGCGTRVLEGFVNVDKYSQAPGVKNYDIFKLPYSKEVDVIFCAHVIEHLPIRHARMAIREWGRVMKEGGKVYLGLPDLETIMYRLLDRNLDPKTREWLLYALFGFQTNPGNRGDDLDYPVDPGQFHTCGFTQESIRSEMEAAGFRCDELFVYDGWGTPSIWLMATKL